VASAVTADKLGTWWPLLVFSLVNTLLGVLLGLLLARMLGLNKTMARFVMMCLAFKNATSLPLPLLQGLLSNSSLDLLNQADETLAQAIERGSAYILFVAALMAIVCLKLFFTLSPSFPF